MKYYKTYKGYNCKKRKEISNNILRKDRKKIMESNNIFGGEKQLYPHHKHYYDSSDTLCDDHILEIYPIFSFLLFNNRSNEILLSVCLSFVTIRKTSISCHAVFRLTLESYYFMSNSCI